MSLKRVLLHEYLMSGLLIQLAVRLAVTGNINRWFFVYVSIAACFIGYGFKSSLDTFCRFCTGLFTIFALGITGYTIIPAEGPYIYLCGKYTRELSGYFFTKLNQIIVCAGTARFDVFPSLHMGGGLYILLFLFKNTRKAFYVFLIPFITLVFSTIYLRYHYLVDLICGVLLSTASYFVCMRLSERFNCKEQTTGEKL